MNGIKIQFKSHFKDIEKQLNKAEERKLKLAGALLMRKLRAAAPKDSGNLRKSIRQKYWASTHSIGVGCGRRYGGHAWLVENGHEIIGKDGEATGKRVAGRPFFKPTWDAAKPEIERILKEEIL